MNQSEEKKTYFLQDLADKLHEEYPEYRKYEYEDFLKIFLDVLEGILQNEDHVCLTNFGVFETSRTKDNVANLIAKPKATQQLKVKFRPSAALIARMREKDNAARKEENYATISED